ncbi:MAG: universal stress protein, partial [Paramuribaculum sp.]|nr:universal stress protein [Paramuribaculum sp.]
TKERELIGSVTAEVLDTVRYPIFTVPPASPSGESSACDTTADYRRVMMFVTFEQDDFLTLDALHRFLPHSENLEITFVRIGKRAPLYNAHTYHNLLNYAEKHYPECHFSVSEQTVASLMEGFGGDSSKHNPDLIVVPNKKKNAFARLFNPGIAHRILFNADIPMMVVPV